MSYNQNCSYSLAGPTSNNYSTLESIAYHSAPAEASNINYMAEAAPKSEPFYMPKTISKQLYNNSTETLYQIQKIQPTNVEYSFIPDDFLAPGRRKRFIGDAEQIEEEIKEAFLKTTNFEFPPDIEITICDQPKFKKMISQPGVRGFSINKKETGQTSEIFVLNDDLAHVMLTIGHEIGHVISKPLNDKKLEEAKAFAFSKAWMKTIKEHNIAGLKNAITLENPAQNGIHDIAHQFVNKQLKHSNESENGLGKLETSQNDKDPLTLYWEIVGGKHAIAI